MSGFTLACCATASARMRTTAPTLRASSSFSSATNGGSVPGSVCSCAHALAEPWKHSRRNSSAFWRAVPAAVLQWQSALAAATSKLHRFLSMDDDERDCRIVAEPSCVTWLCDFRAAYERAMDERLPAELDATTLAHFGFAVADQRENVCKACKQIAKGGRHPCCRDYALSNRTKKRVIHGMRLVLALNDDL